MDINRFLSGTFLFKGLDSNEISKLTFDNPPEIICYKRGDLVYSSNDGGAVGFVMSGECEIRRIRSDGSKIVLNTLHENASFGILSVFSEDDFPTQIYATKNCCILYFKAEQIKDFVNSKLHISANLINFLVNRVSFLNKKIETFSGTRVEDRLAAFILIEKDKFASVSFPFNVQKTAEEINAGRASVYRALSVLEEDGLIKLENKIIYILDQQGLERIVK